MKKLFQIFTIACMMLLMPSIQLLALNAKQLNLLTLKPKYAHHKP